MGTISRVFREVLSLLRWSMLAATTVGPGTVVTCSRAGAEHGLDLIWALVFATLLAFTLQGKIDVMSHMSFMYHEGDKPLFKEVDNRNAFFKLMNLETKYYLQFRSFFVHIWNTIFQLVFFSKENEVLTSKLNKRSSPFYQRAAPV